jgi:hypothetical protein
MNVTTIGIDLAKNVFQIHGVDPHGHAVLRKRLKRAQLFTFFANLRPCLIGMESCCGSHFFARRLEGFGHTVKLIAPQFVKPYVKTNKNDAADAEAICEAVARPNMRFVPAKNMRGAAAMSQLIVRWDFVISMLTTRRHWPCRRLRRLHHTPLTHDPRSMYCVAYPVCHRKRVDYRTRLKRHNGPAKAAAFCRSVYRNRRLVALSAHFAVGPDPEYSTRQFQRGDRERCRRNRIQPVSAIRSRILSPQRATRIVGARRRF